MSLSGRLALVTGGSSGIGEAVCHALVSQGATVIVACRHVEAAQKVVDSLPGDGKHCAMRVDVGETSSVDKLFHNIRTNFPQPLSIVVNSAAVNVLSPIADCTDELFDEIINVNLKGAFAITRAAGREMIRAGNTLPEGGGTIVIVSSPVAKSPGADIAPYAASKAGVEALAKVAAKELATHQIRCNIVQPGWTVTPMTAPMEARRACVVSRTPFQRSAEPQEIAEAIAFLCSPKSSSYITGASLLVSGGFAM